MVAKTNYINSDVDSTVFAWYALNYPKVEFEMELQPRAIVMQ